MTFEPKGESIEVAMMNFLIENEEDANQLLIQRNKFQRMECQLPFDQNYMRKVVVRVVANDETQVRIYVKGAPETVVPLCTETFDQHMQQKKDFDSSDLEKVLIDVVSGQMAREGLKTLSYAYKDITIDDLRMLMGQYDPESYEFRTQIEQDLTYLCSFGLEDPLRPEVTNSIQLIRYGAVLGDKVDRSKGAKNQVNIRMISGDHIDTALYVAVQVGILTEAEAKIQGFFMTGEEFREQIGDYQKIWDPVSKRYSIEFRDPDRFKIVKSRLRVIARATPEDKLLLIAGIKQAGGLVAMTGESVADALALKEADIGLCMGSGCQVAKDNSDLVILDNDFASIHRSMKWGRAIFNNVKKFIQFQLTVNVVLCFYLLIMAATIGQSPLNVIQLLWANLIMDVLAAIAICTEPPGKQKVLQHGDDQESGIEERISRKEKIINTGMWRTIVGHSVYQLLVLLFLSYFGTFIFFDESFNIVTEKPLNEQYAPNKRMVMNTIIFYTFILMTLFNQINCRVVDEKEMNVFKTLFNNFSFWVIIGGEFAVTIYMVWASNTTLGPLLIGTAPLTMNQQITCWVLGVFSLILHPILKKVPTELFEFMNLVDLEDENLENNFAKRLMDNAKHKALEQQMNLQRRMSSIRGEKLLEEQQLHARVEDDDMEGSYKEGSQLSHHEEDI